MMPRPMPQETVDGLRPPLAGFPYFAHADEFPFGSDDRSDSAVNGWWLADASFLVYGNAEFIQEAVGNSPLPAQGYRLDWLGTPDDNRGMVLSNDETLVVIFRGTRLQSHSVFDVAELVMINQDDLWTDSQFLPTACSVGGLVHHGFLSAYAEINDLLDELVRAKRPEQNVWLTGHSLGGALATLAAAHLGAASIRGICTYGSPRVGNAEFVSVLPVDSYTRFVHRDDWVPGVPPELLGFVHGGIEKRIGSESRRSLKDDFIEGTGELLQAIKSMARNLSIGAGDLPFKISGLADHAPVYYATHLWNQVVQPEACDDREA